MSIVGLNAAQARANSNQDLIIFTEANKIMTQVLTASASGLYETTVTDTEMTQSHPTAVITATEQDPVVQPNATLIVNGSTIVLGTTGTSLNAVIADINDAGVAGVVASKTDDKLVLTLTAPEDNWAYSIGAGTANSALGITTMTETYGNPSSVNFYYVWQGTQVDRAAQQQMDQVIRHFENLGYKIQRTTNINSGKTFNWYVYW